MDAVIGGGGPRKKCPLCLNFELEPVELAGSSQGSIGEGERIVRRSARAASSESRASSTSGGSSSRSYSSDLRGLSCMGSRLEFLRRDERSKKAADRAKAMLAGSCDRRYVTAKVNCRQVLASAVHASPGLLAPEFDLQLDGQHLRWRLVGLRQTRSVTERIRARRWQVLD